MYGQGPVYDERYAEAVARKQEALLQKSYDIGTKMKRIFWMIIIIVMMTVLLVAQEVMVTLGFQFLDGGTMSLMLVSSILIIVCSIVYAISLESLKCYNSSFGTAAVLYVIIQVLQIGKNYVSGNSVGSIISIVVAVLQILQVRTFVDATASSLREIDRGVELSWRSFWNVYVKLLYAMILVYIIAMIPILILIAAPLILVITVASIIMNLWMLALIWKTGSTMTRIVKLN